MIHHSDPGGPYTSIAVGLRGRKVDGRPSMRSVGDAYDNALCESVVATLETELLAGQHVKPQGEARMAVFSRQAVA